MLLQGDALDRDFLYKHIKEGSIDLIILDPPYGIGNKALDVKKKKWKKTAEEWDSFSSVDEQYQFYQQLIDTLKPLLKSSGNLFVFGSFHNIYLIGEILQRHAGMKIVNSIVWNKINAFFNVTRTGLIESTEHIIWAALSKKHYFDYDYAYSITGKQLRNVWTSALTPNHERVGHPHQKPEWLIERIVKIGCPTNGTVLDPMCGSGTTEVVCQHEKINSICVEKNRAYFDFAKRRVSRETERYPYRFRDMVSKQATA